MPRSLKIILPLALSTFISILSFCLKLTCLSLSLNLTCGQYLFKSFFENCKRAEFSLEIKKVIPLRSNTRLPEESITPQRRAGMLLSSTSFSIISCLTSSEKLICTLPLFIKFIYIHNSL